MSLSSLIAIGLSPPVASLPEPLRWIQLEAAQKATMVVQMAMDTEEEGGQHGQKGSEMQLLQKNNEMLAKDYLTAMGMVAGLEERIKEPCP